MWCGCVACVCGMDALRACVVWVCGVRVWCVRVHACVRVRARMCPGLGWRGVGSGGLGKNKREGEGGWGGGRGRGAMGVDR